MRARFSAPVQTGPGAHPASCTMGTGSFPGVKSGRGVTPWSRKSRAIPLLPLWAVRPVQSLSTCTRVHFILPLPYWGDNLKPQPNSKTSLTTVRTHSGTTKRQHGTSAPNIYHCKLYQWLQTLQPEQLLNTNV